MQRFISGDAGERFSEWTYIRGMQGAIEEKYPQTISICPGQFEPHSSLADIKLDPGFRQFYEWCKAHDIPVIIVSR